ncbi:methyl-accepting chemotaxis protein [Paenibacillus pinistramenti]|uniref:methyl-accepting chemotaxis protein n=1 Tax=Paenibacillus pinistramenti TaxID=1768003 RepID=UPI00110834D4|nr:methyl-accepting chemotaxis protein [Paenibacillus pinistramenti]
MKIKTKIYVYFSILILFLIAGVGYQTINTQKQSGRLDNVKTDSLKSLHFAGDTKAILSQIQTQQVLGIAQLGEPKNIQAQIDDLSKQFSSDLDQYVGLNPEDKAKVDDIRSKMDKALHNDQADMNVINDITSAIDNFSQAENNEAHNTVTGVMDENNRSNLYVALIQLGGLLFSIFAAWDLIRSFNRPVRQLTAAAQKISEGDLSEPIVNKKKDEIGTLANIFEQMRQSLSSFIEAAQHTSSQVAVSSQQLTDQTQQSREQISAASLTAQNIAEGANVQMVSISETARAMEEISLGVQRISETTSAVSQLSVTNEQEAKAGNEQLQAAVVQMDHINQVVAEFSEIVGKLNEHSQNINQITDLIASIAAQTNLLSFNAGIEAARAGEHGKGFAVVAAEIRKLAAESKASSDQISDIVSIIQKDTLYAVKSIEAGVTQVEQGRESIHSANEAFKAINKSTGEISMQIQEISAASEQLSASSEEVSAAINELEGIAKKAYTGSAEMAQASETQNSSIQNMARAAELLNESSQELGRYIAKYKVS